LQKVWLSPPPPRSPLYEPVNGGRKLPTSKANSNSNKGIALQPGVKQEIRVDSDHRSASSSRWMASFKASGSVIRSFARIGSGNVKSPLSASFVFGYQKQIPWRP
jgi:hypothetical protein